MNRASDQQVGVIGLGAMGGAMAENLAASGFTVFGCDPSPHARERAAAAGVHLMESPREVATRARILLLSLPKPEALFEVTDNPDGLRTSMVGGRIVIEAGTFDIATKRRVRSRLAERGHVLLDAPLSGTSEQARQRDIVVFASGDEAAFRDCQHVLRAVSRQQFYLGEFGNGSLMKIIANHLVTIHNVAVGEAFALAQKAGLDLATVYDVIRDNAGSPRMLQMHSPQMVRGLYDAPTATVNLHAKDLAIINAFARSLAVPLPLFEAALQHYRAAK